MHLQYLSAATQERLVTAPAAAYVAAVAIAAGFSVTIPTAPVQDITAYAEGAVNQAVDKVVGIFNEVRPLDIDASVRFARQVYTARYEVAHGLMLEKTGEANFGGVLDLFGIGLCVSAEFVQQLSDNSAAIMKVLPACITAARQIATPGQA